MSGETLTIKTPDGDFSAYVARPAAARAPAVVVIQEIFGVNAVMRGITDDLAAAGYLAICPDLFWRIEPGIDITDQSEAEWKRAFELYQSFDVEQGVEDIAATIDAIRADPGCSGKVGAVGFCLGGLLAFLTATRTDADASAAFYGVGIEGFVAEAEKLARPLLIHIAEEDQFVPKEAQKVITDALGNHTMVEIHTYPGRDHAFARKGGAHYDAADAATAQARTLEFFSKKIWDSAMLAIQAARTGGPEVLDIVDLPVPTPGPGEILIRHEAVGLNFIDTYYRSGLYPARFPAVMGVEGAGVVEAVGEGVTRFKPGDRAAYAGGPLGAYAQARTYKAERAVAIPADVSSEVAAAGLLKGMTAEFLLRRCYPVKAGQTILVHAAAGGVGSILVQWARAIGAQVIGTVGDSAKAGLATAHGCDHVILYKDEDVAARVREITGGRGVPVVYDGVGAATFEASLGSLARRGMLVSYGNASGPPPAVTPARLAQGGSLFLTRPGLFDYVATREELDESAGALFAMLASGAVKIDIAQRFPLREARAAHEALEGRATVGSTLLIP